MKRTAAGRAARLAGAIQMGMVRNARFNALNTASAYARCGLRCARAGQTVLALHCYTQAGAWLAAALDGRRTPW